MDAQERRCPPGAKVVPDNLFAFPPSVVVMEGTLPTGSRYLALAGAEAVKMQEQFSSAQDVRVETAPEKLAFTPVAIGIHTFRDTCASCPPSAVVMEGTLPTGSRYLALAGAKAAKMQASF